MENFTPISSLLGGVLIGLSASLMLVLHGRISGISGILGQALPGDSSEKDKSFRLWFLGGLIAGGVPFALASTGFFAFEMERSTLALVVAGLLVGVGTRLGSGCTSGHGVCGVSRLSRRSIIATLTFLATGALSVFVVKAVFGGTV